MRVQTCIIIKGSSTAKTNFQLSDQVMEDIAADIDSSDLSAYIPLLSGRQGSHWSTSRYRTTRKCVSSRAALLILLWSFVVGLLSGVFLNPDMSVTVLVNAAFAFVAYSGVALVTCFHPLAGFLADTKCGRYKTVVVSTWLVAASVPFLLVVTGIFTVMVIKLDVYSRVGWVTIVAALGCIGVIVLSIGLIGFTANVVQFGMDQLHDSPGEDRTLFIHWYVWTYYTSILIDQLACSLIFPNSYYKIIASDFDFNAYSGIGYFLMALLSLSVVVVLPIILCLARHGRRWFLIEQGQNNPYKLVYRVTKFSRQHKTPVRRSAFTYCEDEVPSGLDLGKGKYGGPFTTEQVEDVKVFYGILKVLLSFGVVFFLDFAANSTLPSFSLHTTPYSMKDNMTWKSYHEHLAGDILITRGLLSPLLIFLCIPLYLCLLRPIISQYVPGMMKRMGLGMIFVVLSLLATFSMDTGSHNAVNKANSSTCMFSAMPYSLDSDYLPPILNPGFLTIQLTLSALSRMLIYAGVFEFICSQSPHSMKGLLIGVLYAIRGFYQTVAAILLIPFYFVPHLSRITLSCGFFFYLINIVIGLVAVLVYVWVAKRYRYRVRDELCNVHQYAEEYYSNKKQERYYDYSRNHC